MFTRADYNKRRRRLGIFAMVHRPGWRNWRPSQLVRFRCGDLAWWGGGDRFSWGISLSFMQRVQLRWNVFNEYRAWRCDIDTRKEEGDPWMAPPPKKERRPKAKLWLQLALPGFVVAAS